MAVAASREGGVLLSVDRSDTEALLAEAAHPADGDARPRDGGLAARRPRRRAHETPARPVGQARRRPRPLPSAEVAAPAAASRASQRAGVNLGMASPGLPPAGRRRVRTRRRRLGRSTRSPNRPSTRFVISDGALIEAHHRQHVRRGVAERAGAAAHDREAVDGAAAADLGVGHASASRRTGTPARGYQISWPQSSHRGSTSRPRGAAVPERAPSRGCGAARGVGRSGCSLMRRRPRGSIVALRIRVPRSPPLPCTRAISP